MLVARVYSVLFLFAPVSLDLPFHRGSGTDEDILLALDCLQNLLENKNLTYATRLAALDRFETTYPEIPANSFLSYTSPILKEEFDKLDFQLRIIAALNRIHSSSVSLPIDSSVSECYPVNSITQSIQEGEHKK